MDSVLTSEVDPSPDSLAASDPGPERSTGCLLLGGMKGDDPWRTS